MNMLPKSMKTSVFAKFWQRLASTWRARHQLDQDLPTMKSQNREYAAKVSTLPIALLAVKTTYHT
jgi:hypothetical protein